MEEKQNTKEKILQKSGNAVENVGKVSKATGTATSAVGKTTRVAGTAGKYGGKAVNYAGKGISSAGKGVMKAGQGLNSSGSAAVLGEPLTVLGSGLTAAGKTTEVAGTAVEKTGDTINKSGKAIDNAGKKMRAFGSNTKEKGRQIKSLDNTFNSFKKDYKMSSKRKKLVLIAIVSALLFNVIFIVVLISPLISLGIIDIGSSNGSSSSSLAYANYSSVKDSTSYWWPIGGTEAVTSNGNTFTAGEPAPTTITSNFGTRIDPYDGQESFHSGIDIASNDGSYGTYIIAARDGTVIYPNSDSPTNCVSNGTEDPCGGGYGNYVMIEHSDGSVTVYAHMYENSITVHYGDQVSQGQVIGKMGSSGRSTGAHLHFEVRVNGKQVNPLNFISESNPYPSKSSSSYINASEVKQSICKSLKNKNYSDVGTAAILTNMYYESSFDPTATGDGETSYGLCQWHESRYDNLKSSYPTNYHTPEAQFNYLIYELENSYSSLNKSLLEDTLSAEDLTYNFCATFEKPANTEKTCKNRGSNSSEYLTYVTNGCN